MKILFLCGCLEPGHDGVGDYTRLLAVETIRQGHECYIIALNDRFVNTTSHLIQNIGLQGVEVKRFPTSFSFAKRVKLAKLWIEQLSPEWISIQFVIFSFHPKGLPFGLNKSLATLCRGRKVHLMFHELWVGISNDASRKHILWGAVQRYLIRDLLTKLKPHLIATQSELYIQLLRKLKMPAHLLPLFSNVPRKDLSNNKSNFKKEGISNIDTYLSLVVFGTIHPAARIEELISKVNSYIKKHNYTIVCLTLVGRCGEEEGHWVNMWKAAGLSIKVLGEQPTDVISEVLSCSHIGISTSALPMIDKSGTVAAMMEHHLPVICVGHQWLPRGLKSPKIPDGIFDVSEENCIERSLKYIIPTDIKRTITGVAEDLIKKLTSIH